LNGPEAGLITEADLDIRAAPAQKQRMDQPLDARDKLLLVSPGFEDPAFPGRQFYCWHCALLEGVLGSFPALASKLIVERVAWPRPRQSVIELVGESNQSLPLLLLARGSNPDFATGKHAERLFIAGKDAILQALHSRHGFPLPHP
jgi:hypothetical protein